jgi:hypothetical protein
MSVPYYGDFAEDDTVLIPFNTFDSNDPSASVTVTDLADADIKVHKDGGLTQIATDGATVAINFDGITGNHMITIDTSVHADYSTGSEYAVRIEGATVDGATGGINVWVGAFSIERAGGALAVAKLAATAAALTTHDGKLDTAQTDLDTLTGTDGATLATAQGNYAPALASVATEGRLAELDAANLPADVDTMLTRLSAARAGYLDELAAANLPADIDTIVGKLPSGIIAAGIQKNVAKPDIPFSIFRF